MWYRSGAELRMSNQLSAVESRWNPYPWLLMKKGTGPFRREAPRYFESSTPDAKAAFHVAPNLAGFSS